MDKGHHVGSRRAPSGSRAGSEVRTDPQPKVIREDRAAALLGLTAEKLRRLSSETGLGRAEYEDCQERVVVHVRGALPAVPVRRAGQRLDSINEFFPAPQRPNALGSNSP